MGTYNDYLAAERRVLDAEAAYDAVRCRVRKARCRVANAHRLAMDSERLLGYYDEPSVLRAEMHQAIVQQEEIETAINLAEARHARDAAQQTTFLED